MKNLNPACLFSRFGFLIVAFLSSSAGHFGFSFLLVKFRIFWSLSSSPKVKGHSIFELPTVCLAIRLPRFSQTRLPGESFFLSNPICLHTPLKRELSVSRESSQEDAPSNPIKLSRHSCWQPIFGVCSPFFCFCFPSRILSLFRSLWTFDL